MKRPVPVESASALIEERIKELGGLARALRRQCPGNLRPRLGLAPVMNRLVSMAGE
jgi:hypothetical protein